MADVQEDVQDDVTNADVASELKAAKLKLLKVITSGEANFRQVEAAAQAYAYLNGTLTASTSLAKSN